MSDEPRTSPQTDQGDLADIHREAGPRVQAELDQQVGTETAAMREQHGAEVAAQATRDAPAGARDAGASPTAAPAPDAKADAGERGSLPSEVAAQYPQTDLSDVVVVRNSAEAKKRATPGFATRDEIHVAPGVDELTVLRHEAAHVVQMRKNQPDKPPASEAANEQAARGAETGKPQRDADVGTAPADATRHYDGKGGDPAKDVPDPVDFLGQTLSQAGSYQTIGVKNFDLFDIEKTSPQASFPVLGFINFSAFAQVKLKATFSSHADLTWSVIKNAAGKPVWDVSVTPHLSLILAGSAKLEARMGLGALGLAGIQGSLGASGRITGSYGQGGKPFTAEVSTDGVTRKSAGAIGGGALDAKAMLDFTAAVSIYAGLPDFIAKGWRWEQTKSWTLFAWAISMPVINVPEIALPGPDPSAIAGVKDQLAAGKPANVDLPGTTLTPT